MFSIVCDFWKLQSCKWRFHRSNRLFNRSNDFSIAQLNRSNDFSIAQTPFSIAQTCFSILRNSPGAFLIQKICFIKKLKFFVEISQICYLSLDFDLFYLFVPFYLFCICWYIASFFNFVWFVCIFDIFPRFVWTYLDVVAYFACFPFCLICFDLFYLFWKIDVVF